MPVEHVDVLIVGAGLSGVGAACQVKQKCPGTTFAVLEARDAIGGTWDLFRYPGIRSDSDMFTLGYRFRPWTQAKAIADGPSIRAYIRETAAEHRIGEHIRFGHRVVSAAWDSDRARWTVEAERTGTGETVRLTCGFLFTCSGYYRYDEGYTPDFPGRDAFAGPVVHPQHWPEDLDYAGKRVVVIGSGATAVTLVPAMAGEAAHVTMLQRSPSYVLAMPERDPLAELLRRVLPPRLTYPVVRWKNTFVMAALFQLSRRRPGLVKRIVFGALKRSLPEGYDIDRHFRPRYEPWDQRMCFVPNGDLFKVLREGSASVVTDTIETFTEHGIRLGSGEELPADVIVTATGLNLLPVGGIALTVDGAPVELADTVAYKGMMLSGVPNFALTIGYTNASWTLKADLVAGYVCRLVNHMREHGYQQCTPTAPGAGAPLEPLIDLKAGYVLRGVDSMPKQGPAAPWRLYQNYPRDVLLLRHGPLDDEGMRFSRASTAAAG
ncbi:FAD-containing monooxygenase EthA [Prauserella coralliicola]|nr:FAD-containing monooxygenase EthA [Prauserella coralliicola]